VSLFKRKDSPYWWVKISHRSGCLQQSTGTTEKTKARELHDKLKASLWEQDRLGVKPSHKWNEAVLRWLEETTHKASQHDDKAHLRWLDRHLGGLPLRQINRDLLDRITADRLAGGVSNATVNRMLEVVRAILRKATYEWDWLDKPPRVRLLREPTRRIRWITREEAARLVTELPDHLAAMMRFTLETGLRQANVRDLEWSQVDLSRRVAWVHPDQAKARKAIGVPLSPAAVIELREQTGKHPRYVFTYRGKPVRQVNTKAWVQALKRAGIENFRWHDLRHTWASWHVQSGTPLYALQELGGWESPQMVRRYAHLSTEHLATYAERMSGGLRAVDGGSPATIWLRKRKGNEQT